MPRSQQEFEVLPKFPNSVLFISDVGGTVPSRCLLLSFAGDLYMPPFVEPPIYPL